MSHPYEEKLQQSIKTDSARREYFAIMALQTMSLKNDGEYSDHELESGTAQCEAEWVASAAVRYADALIAELNKEKK